MQVEDDWISLKYLTFPHLLNPPFLNIKFLKELVGFLCSYSLLSPFKHHIFLQVAYRISIEAMRIFTARWGACVAQRCHFQKCRNQHQATNITADNLSVSTKKFQFNTDW